MSDQITTAAALEATLRAAGRARRKVRARIRFDGEGGESEYERSYEPYAIVDGDVVVFSLFRNEFRTISIADIKSVEVMDETFRARRDISM
jgi:hypothetical protein